MNAHYAIVRYDTMANGQRHMTILAQGDKWKTLKDFLKAVLTNA